jgi:hypothetical protein
VRKAFRRFGGFFEGIWETVNGRPPAMGFLDRANLVSVTAPHYLLLHVVISVIIAGSFTV